MTKEDLNTLKVIGRRYIENWKRLADHYGLNDDNWQMEQWIKDQECFNAVVEKYLAEFGD